jgi:hypothetical protein
VARRRMTVPLEAVKGSCPFTAAMAEELALRHGLLEVDDRAAKLNELAVNWAIFDATERYPDRSRIARELAGLSRQLEKSRKKLQTLSPGARWVIEEQLRRWNARELEAQETTFFYLISAAQGGRLLKKLPDNLPGRPSRSQAGDKLLRSLAKIYWDRARSSASLYRERGKYTDKGVGAFVQEVCTTITGERPPLSRVEVVLRERDGN